MTTNDYSIAPILDKIGAMEKYYGFHKNGPAFQSKTPYLNERSPVVISAQA